MNGNTILTFSTVGTDFITFYTSRTVLALVVGGGGSLQYSSTSGSGGSGIVIIVYHGR